MLTAFLFMLSFSRLNIYFIANPDSILLPNPRPLARKPILHNQVREVNATICFINQQNSRIGNAVVRCL